MRLESEANASQRVICKRDASQSTKFRLNVGEKTFTQQFFKFYETRLSLMTDRLTRATKQRWGTDLPIHQICDIVHDKRCILLGTTFKQMQLQPSILKELGDDLNIPVQPVVDNFTSDEDVLYLEDMLQRITLTGDIKAADFVTGVSIAVKGKELESNPGYFVVEDFCFAESPTSIEPTCDEDVDVLFVSGLEFGGSKCNKMASQLLVDYVSGSLQNCEEARKIARVIIAGDSVSHEVHDKEQHYKAKYLTKSAVAGTVEAVKDLNAYLKLLTKTLPVTIMPGANDPTNCTLPQQPLHPCMFSDESGFLELSTNPYECDISGLRLLGHSGQPCTNIKQYSKLDSSVDIMKSCLSWSHMAPTAPDTLASYPFTDVDPFIIESYPHLFFAGNQSELQADHVTLGGQRCLCLAIPRFSETGICVKVNLKTLDWEPIQLTAGDE